MNSSTLTNWREMSDTYLMGTDQKCYVVLYDVLCQVPSSQYLKMSYFTLKDELQHADKLERKRYDILATREKMIYINKGCKSATLRRLL